MQGKRRNLMVRDQASTDGVEKLSPFALHVLLGQEQCDVQGRCRVATTNSLYAKPQFAYGEFNRVNGQESLCSGLCLQLHLLGTIPFE